MCADRRVAPVVDRRAERIGELIDEGTRKTLARMDACGDGMVSHSIQEMSDGDTAR
jgi:hypothetical protein